jgi:hypothetical protein
MNLTTLNYIRNHIEEIIVGCDLGDLHMSKAGLRNYRLMFAQGEALHKSYLLHLYEVFAPMLVSLLIFT